MNLAETDEALEDFFDVLVGFGLSLTLAFRSLLSVANLL